MASDLEKDQYCDAEDKNMNQIADNEKTIRENKSKISQLIKENKKRRELAKQQHRNCTAFAFVRKSVPLTLGGKSRKAKARKSKRSKSRSRR